MHCKVDRRYLSLLLQSDMIRAGRPSTVPPPALIILYNKAVDKELAFRAGTINPEPKYRYARNIAVTQADREGQRDA